MKPKIDKTAVFSMLFILSLISIPVFYAVYFTDEKDQRFFTQASQRGAIPEFQEDSKLYDTRIVLRKDKAFTINRSRLVFKGIKDRKIHLDVFLLELDPESAYPHYISMDDAYEGIQLGDSRFKLLKASGRTLQLEIVDLYKT